MHLVVQMPQPMHYLVEHHGAAAEAASGLAVQLRVAEQTVFRRLPGCASSSSIATPTLLRASGL
ncbi:MAG: hypothetical protein ACLTG4_00420 [Oscillospiraceae bacterium]